jgi:hypothetical protein
MAFFNKNIKAKMYKSNIVPVFQDATIENPNPQSCRFVRYSDANMVNLRDWGSYDLNCPQTSLNKSTRMGN